jgi:lipoprotein signal peptidase
LLPSLFLASSLVIASDQMAKAWVQNRLPPCHRIPIALRINLRLTVSPRIGGLDPSRNLLLAKASALLLFAALLYVEASSLHSSVASVAFGAALGGAGSNLYSKLHDGYVIDFIEVLNIPLFNVADIAITVGSPFTAIIILRSLLNVH